MKKIFYKKKRIKIDPFGHWIESETEFEIMGMTDGENSFEHPYVETDIDYFETTNLKIEKDEKGKPVLKVTKNKLYETEQEVEEMLNRKKERWNKMNLKLEERQKKQEVLLKDKKLTK